MKKALLITAIIGLGVATLCGCGKSVSYQEACRANDFETAHKCLGEIYENFLNTWNSQIGNAVESRDKFRNKYKSRIVSAAMKYSSAASYVLSAEARYIIANYPDEANDRIAYLFNEIQVTGEKVNSYESTRPEDIAKYDCYIQTVKCNNELCDVVLNLAIQLQNKELAKLALSYYRENSSTSLTYVYWSDKDKAAAQAKYEEAFGKDEVVEENNSEKEINSEEVKETAPAKSTPKKRVNRKRRRR